MGKLIKGFLVIAFFVPMLTMGQGIDHLKGKWQDEDNVNKFDLEVEGSTVRWKNEKSENWNNLTFITGTEFRDDDGYKYIFNGKKGTVKVINPDNERDIRVAKMIDFIPPGKNKDNGTIYNPSTSEDAEYRGAHGFLIGYRGSLDAPIGFVIGGIGKKFGIYGAIRFSTRPVSYGGTQYKCNDNHQITSASDNLDPLANPSDDDVSYVYTGHSEPTRGEFIIGVNIPIQKFISTYAGLGFGWANTWEVYDRYDNNTQQLMPQDPQIYAINEDSSIPTGLALEAGGMFHISVFNASLGFSLVNFQAPDLVLGIGFQF